MEKKKPNSAQSTCVKDGEGECSIMFHLYLTSSTTPDPSLQAFTAASCHCVRVSHHCLGPPPERPPSWSDRHRRRASAEKGAMELVKCMGTGSTTVVQVGRGLQTNEKTTLTKKNKLPVVTVVAW